MCTAVLGKLGSQAACVALGARAVFFIANGYEEGKLLSLLRAMSYMPRDSLQWMRCIVEDAEPPWPEEAGDSPIQLRDWPDVAASEDADDI